MSANTMTTDMIQPKYKVQPKYKQHDIIITRGNKKRHIYGQEPFWSTTTGYRYQVDYCLGCTSEGEVIESNILRISDEEGRDNLIPL